MSDEDMVMSESGGEKMLPQSQVDHIVKQSKEQAARSARRQADEEYLAKLQKMEEELAQARTLKSQDAANMNHSRDMDFSQIKEQVKRDVYDQLQAEAKAQQEQAHLAQVADSYYAKVDAAKPNYDDFDEIMKDFNPKEFPQIVYLVSGMENAGDVIYDIAKNPRKLAEIHTLALSSPQLARRELARLSSSIAENRKAQAQAEQNTVQAPLDRLNASRTTGSNGKMSIRDLRNQDWLRK